MNRLKLIIILTFLILAGSICAYGQEGKRSGRPWTSSTPTVGDSDFVSITVNLLTGLKIIVPMGDDTLAIGYALDPANIAGGTGPNVFVVTRDGGTVSMVIDSSGNVGIGTSAPVSTLNINGGFASITNGLSFGDGDTGFFEQSDDEFTFKVGSAVIAFVPSMFRNNSIVGWALSNVSPTSTAPVYSFFTDLNTGMSGNKSDELYFITGGVNAITIDVSQNVGIGTSAPSSSLHVDSNGANTVAIQTFENTAGDVQLFRIDATPEGSVTGSIGDMAVDGTNGFFYIKKSGSATSTGWQVTGGASTYKSYSLSNPGNAGTFYVGGHYAFAAADANLTIGGAVAQTFGTAGQAHGSHAFAVASGAGGTDLVLTVTGVSITDAGARNDSDSEIIVADADAASANEYFETAKKWLGQITYTLTGAAGTFDFNYGFVKYEDFGNRDFIITDFEGTGEARANETGLNIELLHHESTAFVYSAAAFVPNQTALVSMATDYGTNNDVANGDGFAYKRTGLTQAVNGDSGEGVLIRVTTAVNNSINDASFHLGATLK